jgi:hypothetical protein
MDITSPCSNKGFEVRRTKLDSDEGRLRSHSLMKEWSLESEKRLSGFNGPSAHTEKLTTSTIKANNKRVEMEIWVIRLGIPSFLNWQKIFCQVGRVAL